MLSLFARLYGLAIAVRNFLYDKGVFEVHDLGVWTVSIGNITAGGTGKTPLVVHVAGILAEQGERVCVLTRGYGRDDESERVLVSDGESVLADAATGGDEPVEIAGKLLGKAIVIADADRVGAAEWARRRFGVTALVLDDGFQHRKVRRDVDIVCIDVSDPFGSGKLLPAGRLREPTKSLSRASVIVLMQSAHELDISMWEGEVRQLAPDAPISHAHRRIRRFVECGSATATGTDNLPSAVFAFCGIANPQNFLSSLSRQGVKPVGLRAFPDHHRYMQADVDSLGAEARNASAEALVTTAKDAVKFGVLKMSLPCFVAEMELSLDNPADFEEVVLGDRPATGPASIS